MATESHYKYQFNYKLIYPHYIHVFSLIKFHELVVGSNLHNTTLQLLY
jgi:hypothetical protein